MGDVANHDITAIADSQHMCAWRNAEQLSAAFQPCGSRLAKRQAAAQRRSLSICCHLPAVAMQASTCTRGRVPTWTLLVTCSAWHAFQPCPASLQPNLQTSCPQGTQQAVLSSSVTSCGSSTFMRHCRWRVIATCTACGVIHSSSQNIKHAHAGDDPPLPLTFKPAGCCQRSSPHAPCKHSMQCARSRSPAGR